MDHGALRVITGLEGRRGPGTSFEMGSEGLNGSGQDARATGVAMHWMESRMLRDGFDPQGADLKKFRPDLNKVRVDLNKFCHDVKIFRQDLNKFRLDLNIFRPDLNKLCADLKIFRHDLNKLRLGLKIFRRDLHKLRADLKIFRRDLNKLRDGTYSESALLVRGGAVFVLGRPASGRVPNRPDRRTTDISTPPYAIA